MELIRRKHCVISGKNDIELLYSFKKFPVYMGVTDEPIENDILEDMNWGISKNSGVIQLMNLVPESVVYQASHGSGSIGETWAAHHRQFADFIYEFHPKNVLEIGGGHGMLAKNYKEKIEWTILEPNPSPVEGTPAKYIKGFFDSNFKNGGNYNCFIHSHTFEHMYEPMKFMESVSEFLSDGDFQFFSLPNFAKWLENKAATCTCFEHTVLLTEPYIDYILECNKFRILKKQYFRDHSVFYAVVKDSSAKTSYSIKTLNIDEKYTNNKNQFLSYILYYESVVKDLNNKLASHEGKLYVFGAHIFTQILVNLGLDTKRILGVLDNDVKKQGKRLYGTNLKVFSPRILKEEMQPAVVLKCGAYSKEIKQDILQNINCNTVFFD